MNKWIAMLLLLFGVSYAQTRDISQQTRMRHLYGATLQAKQPLFIVQYPDSDTVLLSPPGSDAFFPETVEDFLQHPNDWWETPAYVAQQPTPLSVHCDPLGILEKGGRMQVVRITDKKGDLGWVATCWVRLEDPKWSHKEISIIFLTKERWGSESRPTLNTKYLEVVPGTSPTGIVPECEKQPLTDPIHQILESRGKKIREMETKWHDK